jgi:uncharacterized protein (DUF488 family)
VSDAVRPAIYTVGHSTHAPAAFVSLLQAHGIRQVADVRTVPKSGRHPHFNGAALERLLRGSGIAYRHFPELGGFRRPRPDSRNTAWTHPAFRGYADYMESGAFRAGLDALLEFSRRARTAIMCAESVWWRCHRRLLADALVVGGATVWHILSEAPPRSHELSEFARVDGSSLSYPGLL